jgi:hypothetical protein
MWRICAMNKCSRCTTWSSTSLSVRAAGGRDSVVWAGPDPDPAAGVVVGLKLGCTGEDGESWAAAKNAHADKRRTTTEPERTIRIKTFWESIKLIEK